MNESSIRYPGWRVAIACFTMTLFGFGFGFYGQSVYFAELTTRGGGEAPPFATSTVSVAVTAYYLSSSLIMAFTSDLMTRLGPRVFAITGAAMMGVSLFLITRINSVVGLFAAYLAMAPAFAMLTNAAVVNILGLWFSEKRGLAMSLALTGGGVGGVIVVPSLVWLSAKLTFPVALQAIAIVALPVLLFVIAVWIFEPPRVVEVRAVGPGEGAAEQRPPITRRSALRSIHYWTVAGPLMLAIMVQVAFVVHQMAILLPVLGLQGAGGCCSPDRFDGRRQPYRDGSFCRSPRSAQAWCRAPRHAGDVAVRSHEVWRTSGRLPRVRGVRIRCGRNDNVAGAAHSARIPA